MILVRKIAQIQKQAVSFSTEIEMVFDFFIKKHLVANKMNCDGKVYGLAFFI